MRASRRVRAAQSRFRRYGHGVTEVLGLTTTIAVAAALAAALPPAVAQSSRPMNLSSHSAEFFRQLLGGRVLVANLSRHDHERLRAIHLHPFGEAAYCLIIRDNKRDTTLPRTGPDRRWRILDRHHARIRVWRGTEPSGPRGRLPIFYDPASGRVRTEIHVDGRWNTLAEGWVQDTWPRVMADACPDLPPPLPVNEAQTSARFHDLQAQDPSAPIRDFPGSEFSAPGATGLGASGGEPTTSTAEIAAFLKANHERILIDGIGGRHVLVPLPGREELWFLDDEGSIRNVGWLDWSADGATVAIRWEDGRSSKWRHQVGYPFPFTPTGERYAAFRFGDWLAERPRVSLPYMDRQVDFRFKPDGTLEASRTDGGATSGTWRWSGGAIEIRIPGEVRIPGLDEVPTYEWKALAKRVGWPPPRKEE